MNERMKGCVGNGMGGNKRVGGELASFLVVVLLQPCATTAGRVGEGAESTRSLRPLPSPSAPPSSLARLFAMHSADDHEGTSGQAREVRKFPALTARLYPVR